MARSKIGNVLNAMAAFIGVVDEDDAPMMSEKNNRSNDREDYDSRGGYSSPRVREKNRTRPTASSGSKNPRTNSRPAPAKASSSASRSGSNRRKDTRSSDYYSDWNTAPRDQNQYADEIYDSDTTDRNYSYDDNGYNDDFDTRQNENTSRRSSRHSESSASQIIVLELNKLADCKSVIMSLLENKTVFISVEGLPEATVRRVEDTLSGAVCALDATFRRTSEVSYLLAPNSISVSGTRRTTERTY